jgi:hypothetical protein
MFIETDLDDFIISEFGDLRDSTFVKNKISAFEPDIVIHISDSYRIDKQPDFACFFRNSQLELFNLAQTCKSENKNILFINLTPDLTNKTSLFSENFENTNIIELIKNDILFSESFVRVFRKSYNSETTNNHHFLNIRLSPFIGGGDWSLLNPLKAVRKYNNTPENYPDVIHIIDALNGIVRIIKTESQQQPAANHDIALFDNKNQLTTDSFSIYRDWKALINIEAALRLCETWDEARNRGANMRTFTISQISSYFDNNEQN